MKFQSHIDGSYHFFTPERAIDIQKSIGADIIMAFDECTPYPCEYEYAKNSMEMTHRWLDRCIEQMNNSKVNMGTIKHYFQLFKEAHLKIYEGISRIYSFKECHW